MQEKKLREGEKKSVLIAHLESQYKIIRDEIRADKGFVAASPSVLVALLTGELIIAKDKPEALLALPFTVLACGGFMGILMGFLTFAAKYAELIERKLNYLLKEEVYLYEKQFGGPRNDNEKLIPLIIFGSTTASLPLGITAYGLYKIGWGGNQSPVHSHPKWVACSLAAAVVVGLVSIVCAALRMASVAERRRDTTFDAWRERREGTMLTPSTHRTCTEQKINPVA